MNKLLYGVPALIALGVFIGIVITNGGVKDTTTAQDRPAEEPSATHNIPFTNPFAATSTDKSRIEQLQSRVEQINRRLEVLEQVVTAQTSTKQPNDQDKLETSGEPTTVSDGISPNTGSRQMLSVDNLTKAGVVTEMANDIVRRKNDIELKKLELRDRAARERFLGTGRYNRELNELNASDVNLRDELGDSNYDNYLYVTGQTNRVMVASVMIGSQAEFAGVQDGDIILSYDGQKLYDWSELQQATTQGSRGDYVSMNVLRGNQLIDLLVPRGPLGVRLAATRRQP